MDRLGMKVGPALRLRKRLAEASERCQRCLHCAAGRREDEEADEAKKD